MLFVINGDPGFHLITFLMIRTKPRSPVAVAGKTVLEMYPWQCYSVHSILLFVINNSADESNEDFFPLLSGSHWHATEYFLCLREIWIS